MISGVSMKAYILEVCVEPLESALAAERGGADRVELCADLIVGGTIPPLRLFRQIRQQMQLAVHAFSPCRGEYGI